MKNLNHIKTPFYIVYEDKLRRNLQIIRDVMDRADVDIIMAFKANALWKTFPIIAEFINGSTASSINEMKLSLQFLGKDVHAYCPVYTEESFTQFLKGSSHITFNSLAQFEKFHPQIKSHNSYNNSTPVSPGLRVNPRCSIIGTDIYNPCLPGSRFGVTSDKLPENLPEGLEGFHFHALCESDSNDLERLLEAFLQQFGKWLHQLKWLNMGGGHLMTRQGYDIDKLVDLLNGLHKNYPHLKLIMEPGSAFTWETGNLVTEVLDIVEDSGISTAIIDASFTCHMPDCLEMPYKPVILEADGEISQGHIYRIGGNSCLSGDFIDSWSFKRELKPGDRLTFKDMNHYTTVKTNMFNGVEHPSIWLQPLKGEPVLLREFTYEDYKNRMD